VFQRIGIKLSRRNLVWGGMLAAAAPASERGSGTTAEPFLTPQRFGASGDGAHDDTAALQSWISACETALDTGAGCEAYLPAGKYRCTRSLIFNKRNVKIRGAGPRIAQIISSADGPIFKVASIPYWAPVIEAIGLIGDPSSGYGIDTSAVQDQVCQFGFKDIYSYTGEAAIYAPRIFSGYFQNWCADTHRDHAFKACCGPAVSWISCYPGTVPRNKAGYRLCGTINMFACNGINGGGYWGIFGQAPTQTDGFQSDFPTLLDNYPDVVLVSCNIEGFEKTGILLHQSHRQCELIGGDIDPDSTKGVYHSMIRAYYQGMNITGVHNSIKLGLAAVSKGRYTPTGAYLYTDGANFFEDRSGAFTREGIESYYSAPHKSNIPLIRAGSTNDVYGDTAASVSALTPRRLSLQVVRYATKKLTPAGANQNIDVTGYTKVIVSPTAPTSISSATFDETPSAAADYLRNGDLLIEAGSAGLTINHNGAKDPNTFHLSAERNLLLSPGQICRFCRSDTTGQWIQV
jgi:hypothetical protein